MKVHFGKKSRQQHKKRFVVSVKSQASVKSQRLYKDCVVRLIIGDLKNAKDVQCRALTPTNLDRVVRAGLPVQELKDLQTSLDLPMDRLGQMLGISKATIHRRQAEQRLGVAESDRIVRFAKLMGKAVKVMESNEVARKWLNSPQHGLGGAVPLEFAETEIGAREVEDLLGRVEYGVYS